MKLPTRTEFAVTGKMLMLCSKMVYIVERRKVIEAPNSRPLLHAGRARCVSFILVRTGNWTFNG